MHFCNIHITEDSTSNKVIYTLYKAEEFGCLFEHTNLWNY